VMCVETNAITTGIQRIVVVRGETSKRNYYLFGKKTRRRLANSITRPVGRVVEGGEGGGPVDDGVKRFKLVLRFCSVASGGSACGRRGPGEGARRTKRKKNRSSSNSSFVFRTRSRVEIIINYLRSE